MSVRAFIALGIETDLADMLADYADDLRSLDRNGEISWSNPDNYHLTLEFLGEISFADVTRLTIELHEQLHNVHLAQQCVREISYFPFNAKPRVVAALLDKEPSLLNLQARVAKAVRRAGLSVQKQRFTPHISLGRVRMRRTPKLNIRPIALEYGSELSSVVLFESQLHQSGAIHTPLSMWDLAGEPAFTPAMLLAQESGT